ncbi:hypothetical protein KI387_040102, partial [Taxus chinensis]
VFMGLLGRSVSSSLQPQCCRSRSLPFRYYGIPTFESSMGMTHHCHRALLCSSAKQADSEADTDPKQIEQVEIPGNIKQHGGAEIHPWPEWTSFIGCLVANDYFKGFADDEELVITSHLLQDYNHVRNACLNFGRDRFDILSLSPFVVRDFWSLLDLPRMQDWLVNASQVYYLTPKKKWAKIKKPTYVAFIDFKKAYDMVPHEALFRKLRATGVEGKALHFIQELYNGSSVRVRYDGLLSSQIPVKRGVRQGCPASPTLFNIFINDIMQDLEGLGVRVPGLTKVVAGLLFADDLVAMVESVEEMHVVLQRIQC